MKALSLWLHADCNTRVSVYFNISKLCYDLCQVQTWILATKTRFKIFTNFQKSDTILH